MPEAWIVTVTLGSLVPAINTWSASIVETTAVGDVTLSIGGCTDRASWRAM